MSHTEPTDADEVFKLELSESSGEEMIDPEVGVLKVRQFNYA